MTPMTAALRTLGSGRARMTKPVSRSRATGGRHRRRTPMARHKAMAATSTTATLLPETAERCVMPVFSIASVSDCGVRLVSPITKPGNSPRASDGNPDTASRSPERTCSATSAIRSGSPTDVGGPEGLKIATTSSPGSATSNRPLMRTVSRHRTCAHDVSPNNITGVEDSLR